MGHIHILMLFIAACTGLAVLVAWRIYAIFKPSVLVNSLLGYQTALFLVCIVNIIYSYAATDLGGNLVLLEVCYLVIMLMITPALWFMGQLAMVMARTKPSRVLRRGWLAFCLALGSAYAWPLLGLPDLEAVLGAQKWADSMVVTPAMGMGITGFALWVFLRLRHSPHPQRRRLSLAVLVLNGLLASSHLLTVFIAPGRDFRQEDLSVLTYNIYLVLWNLLLLGIFVRILPEMSRPRPADSVPRTGADKPTRQAPALKDWGTDWQTIQGVLIGKAFFKRPGMDLPTASRATGLPRNRISRVIPAATGKTWTEYLNALRLEEFARLAVSPEFGGDLLDAAFEAGFNSKATFYAQVHQATGLAPAAWVTQLRTKKCNPVA